MRLCEIWAILMQKELIVVFTEIAEKLQYNCLGFINYATAKNARRNGEEQIKYRSGLKFDFAANNKTISQKAWKSKTHEV